MNKAAVYILSSEETSTAGRPVSGRFHVRPHLSAALLTRLISSVLARLLSALNDGEMENCDVVALALAVDQSAFTAEVTGGDRKSLSEHPEQRPSTSTADSAHRQGVDASQRKRDCSLVVSKQVTTWHD